MVNLREKNQIFPEINVNLEDKKTFFTRNILHMTEYNEKHNKSHLNYNLVLLNDVNVVKPDNKFPVQHQEAMKLIPLHTDK